MAATEGRVVVTKDEDFVTGFLLRGAPPKLLLISTGNISNDALSRLNRSKFARVDCGIGNT
jgi:predicted nuclease of predicted toxin-antitoxin system